jgi:hypothetical protein
MIAEDDINFGDHIVGIPTEDAITSFELFEWSSAFPEGTDPELLLIARLVYERVYKFNPYEWTSSYIQSYPSVVDIPLNWTHTEVEFLHERLQLPLPDEYLLHATYQKQFEEYDTILRKYPGI